MVSINCRKTKNIGGVLYRMSKWLLAFNHVGSTVLHLQVYITSQYPKNYFSTKTRYFFEPKLSENEPETLHIFQIHS